MAARPIWKGYIQFGMVTIPVGMSPATGSKDLAFNELHATKKTRLKRPRIDPETMQEVTSDQVVKAFEYAKGQYVELSDEDFEKVQVPSKRTIDVKRFVKAEQIDPLYYDTGYLIEPEEVATKQFALFMHALHTKQMTAIAQITLRKREHLCALRTQGGNLLLETLYYADEVRVDLNKQLPDLGLNDAEKQMAEMLVDLMAGDFDVHEYKDAYREGLLALIQAKVEGRELIQTAEAPVQVMDLMDALRASIEAAQSRRAG